MASLKYSSVTLIEKKTIQVSDRKGILSIFGGTRGGWPFDSDDCQHGKRKQDLRATVYLSFGGIWRDISELSCASRPARDCPGLTSYRPPHTPARSLSHPPPPPHPPHPP